MGQLILDLDDREQWGEQVQGKIHPTPPTGTPVPAEDRHAFLLAKAEEEVRRTKLIESGACHWCYGTDFYQGPGGNWICRKCHPPIGTTVVGWTAYKTESGDWAAKRVEIG